MQNLYLSEYDFLTELEAQFVLSGSIETAIKNADFVFGNTISTENKNRAIACFRKKMESVYITTENQTEIAEKIEAAFVSGSGDNFMQKNYFSEVVAVSEYEIENMEQQGFNCFVLAFYDRPAKQAEVKAYEPFVPSRTSIPMESAFFNFLDDFPEFYNHCGL